MFMKLALLSYMRTRRTTCLYLMCLVFDSFFPVLFEGFMTTEKKNWRADNTADLFFLPSPASPHLHRFINRWSLGLPGPLPLDLKKKLDG
jgi:hypothetical protein